MTLTRIVLAFLLMASIPAQAQTGGCVASGVADLAPPMHWSGTCANGRAEGLGVARAGPTAPYGFFAGRMKSGVPGPGVIVLPNGLLEVATAFDARARPVPTDDL